MFKDISYLKKFFGLLIVFVLLTVVSYKRSFKITFDAKKSIVEMHQKLNLMNTSNESIQFLTDKINALDKLIGQEVAPELVQHFLIDYISQFELVTIVQLEEVHSATDDSFNIYTNQLILEGAYNDLINVIYSFEKESTISRITSIKFYTKKDYKQHQKKLFVTLIFQNYEKNI